MYVIEHCPRPLYPPPDDGLGRDRVLFLGPDAHGALLEVIAVKASNGDLWVIHAMPVRRQFEGAFRDVMRWH